MHSYSNAYSNRAGLACLVMGARLPRRATSPADGGGSRSSPSTKAAARGRYMSAATCNRTRVHEPPAMLTPRPPWGWHGRTPSTAMPPPVMMRTPCASRDISLWSDRLGSFVMVTFIHVLVTPRQLSELNINWTKCCTDIVFTGPHQSTHAKNKFVGRIIQFLYYDSGIKTPGYAPAPCHIAGVFRPLPGSRHLTQKKVRFCLQTYS